MECNFPLQGTERYTIISTITYLTDTARLEKKGTLIANHRSTDDTQCTDTQKNSDQIYTRDFDLVAPILVLQTYQLPSQYLSGRHDLLDYQTARLIGTSDSKSTYSQFHSLEPKEAFLLMEDFVLFSHQISAEEM